MPQSHMLPMLPSSQPPYPPQLTSSDTARSDQHESPTSLFSLGLFTNLIFPDPNDRYAFSPSASALFLESCLYFG